MGVIIDEPSLTRKPTSSGSRTAQNVFSGVFHEGGPSSVRAGARVGLGVCALEAKKRSTFYDPGGYFNIVRPRPPTTPPPCSASRGLLGTGTLVAGRPRVGALESVKIITFEAVLGLFWERDSHLLSLTQLNLTNMGGPGGSPWGRDAPRVFLFI